MTLILSWNPLLYIEPGAFKDVYLRELNIRSAFVSSAAQKAGLKALYGLNVKRLKFGRHKDGFRFHFSDTDFLDGLCSLFPGGILHYGEAYEAISVFRCMINATNVAVIGGLIDEMDYVRFRDIEVLYLISVKLNTLPGKQLSHFHTLEKTSDYTQTVHLFGLKPS